MHILFKKIITGNHAIEIYIHHIKKVHVKNHKEFNTLTGQYV